MRLPGSTELYLSGYSDAELDEWAERVHGSVTTGRDVNVYFDNDARVHAPLDARRLRTRLDALTPRMHFGVRPRRATALPKPASP